MSTYSSGFQYLNSFVISFKFDFLHLTSKIIVILLVALLLFCIVKLFLIFQLINFMGILLSFQPTKLFWTSRLIPISLGKSRPNITSFLASHVKCCNNVSCNIYFGKFNFYFCFARRWKRSSHRGPLHRRSFSSIKFIRAHKRIVNDWYTCSDIHQNFCVPWDTMYVIS